MIPAAFVAEGFKETPRTGLFVAVPVALLAGVSAAFKTHAVESPAASNVPINLFVFIFPYSSELPERACTRLRQLNQIYLLQ